MQKALAIKVVNVNISEKASREHTWKFLKIFAVTVVTMIFFASMAPDVVREKVIHCFAGLFFGAAIVAFAEEFKKKYAR